MGPGKNETNPLFIMEKTIGSGFIGPRPKNNGKIDTSNNLC